MSAALALLGLAWGAAAGHLFLRWVARGASLAPSQSRLRFLAGAATRAGAVAGLLCAPAAAEPPLVLATVAGFVAARTALLSWRVRHGG